MIVMKKVLKGRILIAMFFVFAAIAGCATAQKTEPTLKDALDGKFYIGVALNAPQIRGVLIQLLWKL
jgi:hypothetical protein